jgi:hypothetical protein
MYRKSMPPLIDLRGPRSRTFLTSVPVIYIYSGVTFRKCAGLNTEDEGWIELLAWNVLTDRSATDGMFRLYNLTN